MSNDIISRWELIREVEIDASWREGHPASYQDYREKFALAQRREYLADFPLAIEVEATYYCNLKCPQCPRQYGERADRHMSPELWARILEECARHKLPSMLMDHEAESLLNPRFLDMVKQAKDAGIYDLWLHTNANILTAERSARLIEAGLTKINFSLDAATAETYAKTRIGGKFDKAVANVREFLRQKVVSGVTQLRTRVSFVEQQDNIHEKPAFYNLWKDEPGLNMITFQECWDFSPFEQPDADVSASDAELEAKYGGSEPFHCSMPWEMPIIDVDGNVSPCGMPVRDHNKGFFLGNLMQGDTIESCWKSEKMQDLRRLHERGEWYRHPMCRVCVKTMRASREAMCKFREKAT